MTGKEYIATWLCVLAFFAIMEDSPWLAFFIIILAVDVAT